jgi:hypothetical protein
MIAKALFDLTPVGQQLSQQEQSKKQIEQNLKDRDQRHWTAYYCAEKYVKQLLKNPSGATFAPESETQYSELRKYPVISGWVDATNSFGAVLRTQWSCEVVLADDTCNSASCDVE